MAWVDRDHQYLDVPVARRLGFLFLKSWGERSHFWRNATKFIAKRIKNWCKRQFSSRLVNWSWMGGRKHPRISMSSEGTWYIFHKPSGNVTALRFQLWPENSVSAHWIQLLILVGGLEHFLFSHILGIIIPIDFHIFQRVQTTNQYLVAPLPKSPAPPRDQGIFEARDSVPATLQGYPSGKRPHSILACFMRFSGSVWQWGGSIIGVPQNGWFLRKITLKWIIWGYPYFSFIQIQESIMGLVSLIRFKRKRRLWSMCHLVV